MKPSTAKAKGRETEQAFCDWLRTFGIPAERRRLNGVEDKGDVAGWDRVCVEVKSGAMLALPQWNLELQREIAHSGAETGFIAVRPKGRPTVDDWWAVLPMPLLMRLMERAGFVPGDRSLWARGFGNDSDERWMR